jgi:hypothetical protein
MIQVQIHGTNEVRKALYNYKTRMVLNIEYLMRSEGDNLVDDLNNTFPDLKFQGNFFPVSLEYWITSGNFVICKLTGQRVNTKIESQVGRRRGTEETPFAHAVNIIEMINNFGMELTQKINFEIERILKR